MKLESGEKLMPELNVSLLIGRSHLPYHLKQPTPNQHLSLNANIHSARDVTSAQTLHDGFSYSL